MPDDSGLAVSVVVMTRNRRRSLARTLLRLLSADPPPPVIVVDNGSVDGSADLVRNVFPQVRLVPLSRNLGAAARNIGVAVAETPLVAFADDDSWWEHGSLDRAGRLFARHPRVGLVQARILAGPHRALDPVCREMESAPLGRHVSGLPRILGFVACGAIVRREAFSEAGGFDPLLFFFGEESALAMDLASRSWDLVYDPDVVAVHRPDTTARSVPSRRRQGARNRVLTSLMRDAWVAAGREALRGAATPGERAGVLRALAAAPRALLRRRVASRAVLAAVARLRSTPSPHPALPSGTG